MDAKKWFLDFMNRRLRNQVDLKNIPIYHGTRNALQIDQYGFRSSQMGALGQGVYATTNPRSAEGYARGLRGIRPKDRIDGKFPKPEVIRGNAEGLKIKRVNLPQHLSNTMNIPPNYDGIMYGPPNASYNEMVLRPETANQAFKTKGGPKGQRTMPPLVKKTLPQGLLYLKPDARGGYGAADFLRGGLLSWQATKWLEDFTKANTKRIQKENFIGPTIGKKDKDRVKKMTEQRRKLGITSKSMTARFWYDLYNE